MQLSSFSFYSIFILNLYIVYELNNWSSIPTNNLPPNNYLFDTVKLVKNAIESKSTSNGQSITFDGEGSWSFFNDFSRFVNGVNNCSLFYTDSQNNNFLVLGEGTTDGNNNSSGSAEEN